MEINGIYFAKREFYQIIRDIGGVWNDSKERPIVCLLKMDDIDIYWAIPMGNLNHRSEKAKEIDREYLGFNNIHYVIKNKKLISELERKLKRILYFEDSTPNYFRQHITDLKNKLSNIS